LGSKYKEFCINYTGGLDMQNGSFYEKIEKKGGRRGRTHVGIS
jgi:hypothetical protein